MRVRVVTVSDRASRGEYEDRSGPLLVTLLGSLGAVEGPHLVPDEIDLIVSVVRSAVADGVDLLVTTGGTGIGPRDVTPEAVHPLLERELPGIAEAMRALGRSSTPKADLSRGVAGLVGRTLVITLPGSTGGVADGATVILSLAQHIVEQVSGHDH